MTARLTIVSGPESGRSFEVPPQRLTIGRDPSAMVRIEDDRASRLHAAIETRPQGVYVLDLGSSNGLFVNGQLVTEHLLREGDILTIGHTRIRFGDPGPAAPRPAPPIPIAASDDRTIILAPPPPNPQQSIQRTILDHPSPQDEGNQRTVIQP